MLCGITSQVQVLKKLGVPHVGFKPSAPGGDAPALEFPPVCAVGSALEVGWSVGLRPSLAYLLPRAPSILLLGVAVPQPVFSWIFRGGFFHM